MIDFSFSHDDALKADGFQPVRLPPHAGAAHP